MYLRRKVVLYFENVGTQRSLSPMLERAFHVIASSDVATVEAAIRLYKPVIVLAECTESYRRTTMVLDWARSMNPSCRRVFLCSSDKMTRGFDAVREGVAHQPLIWPGDKEDLLSALGIQQGAPKAEAVHQP